MSPWDILLYTFDALCAVASGFMCISMYLQFDCQGTLLAGRGPASSRHDDEDIDIGMVGPAGDAAPPPTFEEAAQSTVDAVFRYAAIDLDALNLQIKYRMPIEF